MTSWLQVLRERLAVWLAPLLFVLVNVGLFTIYESRLSGRVERAAERLAQRQKAAAEATAQRETSERLLARAHANAANIAVLEQQYFATERGRLTQVIREVKDLADRAGLFPETMTYPEELLEQEGLVRRSFVFSVEGDYASLRQFVRLLELSPSFLTLEQIRVNDSGSKLRVDLRISTLFEPEPAARAAAAAQRGPSS